MPKSKKKKKKKQQIDLASLDIETKLVIPPFKLQNVVSTFSLGVSGLNLKYIALKYAFAEFNPQTFAAATLRCRYPRTTALAFASGNMVCTGGRSELESRYAARKYVRIFQQVGIPVCFSNFKIQNIVASASIGFTLKLQAIADDYGPYVTYEADLFPGLIFRSINPKLVFLCFRSGKIVITGAKNKEQIHQTYNSLYCNILIKYRDTENSTVSSSAYRNQIKQQRDLTGL
jgi:transcription initiation factor TFIID TATA-box-binding protein